MPTLAELVASATVVAPADPISAFQKWFWTQAGAYAPLYNAYRVGNVVTFLRQEMIKENIQTTDVPELVMSIGSVRPEILDSASCMVTIGCTLNISTNSTAIYNNIATLLWQALMFIQHLGDMNSPDLELTGCYINNILPGDSPVGTNQSVQGRILGSGSAIPFSVEIIYPRSLYA